MIQFAPVMSSAGVSIGAGQFGVHSSELVTL